VTWRTSEIAIGSFCKVEKTKSVFTVNRSKERNSQNFFFSEDSIARLNEMTPRSEKEHKSVVT
jgi:hypothetical protein